MSLILQNNTYDSMVNFAQMRYGLEKKVKKTLTNLNIIAIL